MPQYIKPKKRILTLLAHPDDETLGCGGTLHRFAQDDAIIHCVIPAYPRMDSIIQNCEKALEILGVQSMYIGRFDDNQMDKYPLNEVSLFFEKQIEKFKPDIVFLHHWNCLNQDHRVCYQAGIIATRNIPAQLICCEVPSSTGYLKPVNYEPNLYVKLDWINMVAKREAMSKYISEGKYYPHSRSTLKLQTLLEMRGGEINQEYAEAFVKIREII